MDQVVPENNATEMFFEIQGKNQMINIELKHDEKHSVKVCLLEFTFCWQTPKLNSM